VICNVVVAVVVGRVVDAVDRVAAYVVDVPSASVGDEKLVGGYVFVVVGLTVVVVVVVVAGVVSVVERTAVVLTDVVRNVDSIYAQCCCCYCCKYGY